MANSASFESHLVGVGNNAGIEVPAEVIEQLGAGKKPPVVVVVNGHEYRSTVAVMGGKFMISFNAATRAATGGCTPAAAPCGDPVVRGRRGPTDRAAIVATS